MATRQDIEIFLDASNFPFEELAEDLWRVESPEDRVSNIMVQLTDPIITITLRLFKVPEQSDTAFFRKLLELNATEMTHGAYAIDSDDYVLLVDTLQLENLDENELKASILSIAFNAVQSYKYFSDRITVP
ncbi:CesT family type III secretion system chaperone [bacterium]|nr:CesT family type III secretion system chaperone [bacterium]